MDVPGKSVLDRGAWGLVLKEAPPEDLVECVRRVAAGERWIDGSLRLDSTPRPEVRVSGVPGVPGVPALTPRELEIVRMLLAAGATLADVDRNVVPVADRIQSQALRQALAAGQL